MKLKELSKGQCFRFVHGGIAGQAVYVFDHIHDGKALCYPEDDPRLLSRFDLEWPVVLDEA